MEKSPAELYGMIVTHLHNDFCHCTTENSRPAVWDTVRRDILAWDNRTPKRFQRELCKLRLVNKNFNLAATKMLYSHGNLTLDNKANHSVLAQITGLRIDLLLTGLSRRLELMDRPGQQQPQVSSTVDAEQIMTAEGARNDFLVELRTLKFPVDSITALEVRLDEPTSDRVDRTRYKNISVFIRNKLHNLTDLYIRGSVAATDAILGSLPSTFDTKLRRVLVSVCPTETPATHNNPYAYHPLSMMGWGVSYDVLPHLERFKELSELYISGCPKGPMMLHPENKGLTKLFLKDVTTSAEHLTNVITGSPILPSDSGDAKDNAKNHTPPSPSPSPLVELALSNVNLAKIQYQGHQYEAGTWHTVFKTAASLCPHLRILHVGLLSYDTKPSFPSLHSYATAGASAWATAEEAAATMASNASDRAGLDMLAALVRARPGAVVSGECFAW